MKFDLIKMRIFLNFKIYKIKFKQFINFNSWGFGVLGFWGFVLAH